MEAQQPSPAEQRLEARKLALIQALITLEREEDVLALESVMGEVQENIRAGQLVIGYRPTGSPVLKQRFLDRLRHTLHDLNHDEFVSLSDLEQRAADW